MFLLLLLAASPPSDAVRRAALTHFAAGRLAAQTDRPATAAKELEAAVRADPGAADPSRELVRVYAALGRDAAAIRVARAVLAADPQDAATARDLGRLLFDGNQFPEAAAALSQAADSSKLGPADRLAVLREWAAAAEKADDWAGTEAALRRAVPVATDPHDAADVQERLGRALTGGKKWAAADAAYRDAARRFAAAAAPDRAARLGWHRAKVLAAAGRPADAVAVMADFLRLRPTTLPPYRDYADWLRLAGRGSEVPGLLAALADRHPAEPRLRWLVAAETVRIDPDAGDALFRPLLARSADPDLVDLFVRAFVAADRTDRVVAELVRPAGPDPLAGDRLRAITTSVKADPAAGPKLLALAATARDWPAPVWELVALLADRAGRLADAEAALRRGFAADPDLFPALYDLLRRQRRWDDLRLLCQQADAQSRNRGAGGLLVGLWIAEPLAELGRSADALKSLDDAARIAARPLEVRLAKAHVLGLLGHPAAALRECDEVLADAATPAQVRLVRLRRSGAYQLLRDFAASERELRAALQDDPDDALVLNDLGYHLADEGRNLPEAEALIRRAIDLDRADARRTGRPEADRGTYLDSLGWVLFKRNDLPGAKAALEQAVDHTDGRFDPVAWDHLGDVRFRLGDAAGARAAWQAADARYADSAAGRQDGRQAEVRRKLRRVP